MQVSNSFRLSQMGLERDLRDNNEANYTPGDIGGPMPLGAEYRWNVPVISYAFDRSFIEYFGPEGIREVELAFKTFNRLPAASSISTTNFSTEVARLNYAAQFYGLYDLKSTTLTILAEQLGLAQPTRNIVVLNFNYPLFEGYYHLLEGFHAYDEAWLNLVQAWGRAFIRRNYDPETIAPSQFVNGERFDFAFIWPVYLGSPIGDTIENNSSGLPYRNQAIADGLPSAGYYSTGISRDDVGGIKYLLSSANINFETPLPDVHRVGAFGLHRGSPNSTPPAAWRPGVEKITFVRHPYFPKLNRSLPLRRRYTDYFYEDGKLRGVRVERVISQPDIMFTVDNGEGTPTNHESIYPVTRTGTTNWINNATSNGTPDGSGPGVIVPRIKFAFRRLGDQASTAFGLSGFWPSGSYYNARKAWGSYRVQDAPMTTYPSQTFLRKHTGDMVVRQTRWDVATNSWTLSQAQFWKLPIPVGGMALLQNSTDQTNWTTQLTVTNNGGVTEWHCYSSNSAEMFRVIPK